MTIILLVLMFGIFVAIERSAVKTSFRGALQVDSPSAPAVRVAHPTVAGFEIPEHLRFHQGHSWVSSEGPALVRVGIDDFAAKLIGQPEEVHLPQRGQWVRQGQKVWSFRVKGELVEMVSPLEGTVSDVNEELIRHPELLTADPYGNSWLMTVRVHDAKSKFRNLLSGNLARTLMDDSARKLASHIESSTGNLFLVQDRANAHGEIAKQLPTDKYIEITKDLLQAA